MRLRPLEAVVLPEHMGSALRGGFGRIFRKVACRLGCREACQQPERCAYGYVFETSPPPGSQILDKVGSAPRPFVIEPPLVAKPVYEKGEELVVGLILVGRAVDALPYFVYSFKELGRVGIGRGKGQFRMEQVATVPVGGDPVAIYGEGDGPVACNRIYRFGLAQLRPLPLHYSLLRLEFVTPTQVQYEGSPVAPREFHILFRSLLRRINFLNYFHCGGNLMEEPRLLIEAAGGVRREQSSLRWEAWERYSSRQSRRVPMGGYVGHVTFCGAFAPFWPWLALGEWVHVGKGATFGLGRYRLSVEP